MEDALEGRALKDWTMEVVGHLPPVSEPDGPLTARAVVVTIVVIVITGVVAFVVMNIVLEVIKVSRGNNNDITFTALF